MAVAIDPARVDELIRREEEALAGKHRASLELYKRASRSLAGGAVCSWHMAPPHVVYMSHGAGSKLYDVDGNEYVDFYTAYGSVIAGHGHPAIAEAVRGQVERGTNLGEATEDAIVVAEELGSRFGLPLWRFTNSGTETTLWATRIMRAATGRDLIVKIEGGYHGHHDALMVSVGPEAEAAGPPDRPASVPYTAGLPQRVADLTLVVPYNDLEALDGVLSEHEGEVAGMILEPIPMNVGILAPEEGYLQGVREITRRHDVLLAFDEVKTGCTAARGGVTELSGVTPDLVCLAKAIGGGLPGGAIGGTEEAMRQVVSGDLSHEGTFSGNPLTMAAMRATLTRILTADAYRHWEDLNRVLLGGIEQAIAANDLPARVQAFGARGMVAWRERPVRNYRDHLEIDPRMYRLSWAYHANRGVFDSLWADPWTLTVQHTEDDVRRYADSFVELAAELGE